MKMIKYIKISALCLALFSFSGCESWLDVRPESELNEKQMFKSEQGFMDALYGVYVNLGKSDLYGGNLSTVLDMTAQNLTYIDPDACPFAQYQSFEYEHPKCAGVTDALWMRLYYCIGLTDNLLKHLDESDAVAKCLNYNYLRGEALALRAFLHFELVRIFAPDVKKDPDYISIPYRKNFSADLDPQLKVSEVYARILEDLEEAKILLAEDVIRTNAPEWLGPEQKKEETDNVTDKNDSYYVTDFLKYRKYRMNYYAVLGVLARVHLNLGTAEDLNKAHEYAMEVINSNKFRFVQKEYVIVEDSKTRDILFTDEFIFGLYSTKIDVFYKNYFDESYGQSKMYANNVRSIYEKKSSDFRMMYWFKNVWGSYYLLKHSSELSYSKEKIRLITLPEMYYIAAETSPTEAYELLNSVADARDISCKLTKNSTREEVLFEVLKEYRKEYFGDGLFFYAYKRLIGETAVINQLGLEIPDEPKVMVFPLPLDEIKYGNRTSAIWQTEK